MTEVGNLVYCDRKALEPVTTTKQYMVFLFVFFLFIGSDIEPYLPTLMETMFSALNNTENFKIRELAVSAIGAIGKTSKTTVVVIR